VDAFSYLAVLLSIVLGLGLTQILTAAGRIIRQRASIRVHWLPILWAAILFVIYLQVWWAMYGMRFRKEWSFLAFGVALAQTALLYLMAALVLPEQVDDEGSDLAIYFDRHHRWFFGLFLLTLIVSVMKDVVLNEELPGVVNLGFHILFAAGCAAGMIVRRWRAQESLGVAFAVAVLAYVGLLFARLR
jgi:hypothetical protein